MNLLLLVRSLIMILIVFVILRGGKWVGKPSFLLFLPTKFLSHGWEVDGVDIDVESLEDTEIILF